jgi:predicted transcriptional regulator
MGQKGPKSKLHALFKGKNVLYKEWLRVDKIIETWRNGKSQYWLDIISNIDVSNTCMETRKKIYWEFRSFKKNDATQRKKGNTSYYYYNISVNMYFKR